MLPESSGPAPVSELSCSLGLLYSYHLRVPFMSLSILLCIPCFPFSRFTLCVKYFTQSTLRMRAWEVNFWRLVTKTKKKREKVEAGKAISHCSVRTSSLSQKKSNQDQGSSRAYSYTMVVFHKQRFPNKEMKSFIH